MSWKNGRMKVGEPDAEMFVFETSGGTYFPFIFTDTNLLISAGKKFDTASQIVIVFW